LAEGKTLIRNAALEPEIMNLIDMLGAMGAKISVNPEERIVEIEGVAKLRGATVRVIPDRNEVVSFVAAALATEGSVFVRGAVGEHIKAFLGKLDELGALYEIKDGGIVFSGKKPYRSVVVETSPHPGFMTDWQQPFCVLLTQAKGESIIHETVYEDRFDYTKDLKQMGAEIEISDECLGGEKCRFSGQTFNHSARIWGPAKLSGKEITMTDIRAGMAHIIAALVAGGESIISGTEHIDRGYEDLDGRLRILGANIKRVAA